MVSFETLYNQFLSSISSYTLIQLSDFEIQQELFNLAERSIASFKFPKISLVYTFNEDEQIHQFNEDITQKEKNIILAYMKLFWIEYQISKEERFQSQYYDNNVRTFSHANMMAQLNRMQENFSKAAKQAEYDYSRIAIDGKPRVGDINV